MFIIEATLTDPDHADAVVDLIDDYARDPMGGGAGLSDDAKGRLIAGLRSHPTTHVFLAYEDDEPAGVAVCFVGFSTFSAKPILNIHDLAVREPYRGQGIGKALIEAVADKARELDCCKLTLEVHAQNAAAANLYKRVGFEDIGYGIHPGPVHFMHRML